MKTRKVWPMVLGMLVLIPVVVQCQFYFLDTDPSGSILPTLERQVRAQHGNHFNVYFVMLDSMIANHPKVDIQEAILDPYGTLKGMVLFWAAPAERDPEDEDSVLVGMFKKGTIIWSTPPVFRGALYQLYAARDLNKDGQVDLVTLWSPRYSYFADKYANIIVFSWSGTVGRIISDYDPVERSAKLKTTGSTLRLVDGKDAFEIRAFWSNEDELRNFFPSDPIPTRPWVVYSWDGTKYTLSSKPKK